MKLLQFLLASSVRYAMALYFILAILAILATVNKATGEFVTISLVSKKLLFF